MRYLIFPFLLVILAEDFCVKLLILNSTIINQKEKNLNQFWLIAFLGKLFTTFLRLPFFNENLNIFFNVD